MRIKYIPVTPAGTQLCNLIASSKKKAWANLIEDASHMPYKGKKGFQRRGYTIEQVME